MRHFAQDDNKLHSNDLNFGLSKLSKTPNLPEDFPCYLNPIVTILWLHDWSAVTNKVSLCCFATFERLIY